MRHFCGILICIILGGSDVFGQHTIPILERKISITATEEKIPSVLNRIGQAAGFSFSYNSAIISQEQLISLNLTNKSVREVLNEIFKGTMNFKEKSNYLIITKAPTPSIKNNMVVIILNGYVEDGQTGEKK